ncbi:MAG: Trx7/PDZ domain-containing (seleno)protein [Planctomycetaceae bacterium]
MKRLLLLIVLLSVVSSSVSAQEKKSREQKVREDLKKVTEEGFWIYNDLPKAFEQAKATGKPIVVVLRCIPCEECVKLDDDLVDTDPVLRPLLEQFVCVRVVSTNGLDLSLFQYDTDQSFAVFMLNADRTIYGRFGTRSHRTEWVGDVSLKGLAEALQGALDLHKGYPANKATLAAKTGPKPPFPSPEQIPALKSKYTSSLNYSGDVVKSCIHCHQIGDALRDHYRGKGEPLPAQILNPYPHPKALGLVLDPSRKATVKQVREGSVADKAGFKAGDNLVSLNGQPLLSMADIQWVLHNIPAEGATVAALVDRGGKSTEISLKLTEGWRELDDISWRASAWGLRRMVTGGLVLEPVQDSDRGKNGVPESGTALRVKFVGQYGEHAAGKNAGVQKDDIIVAYDGRSDLLTDSDVLRHGIMNTTPGQKIKLEIVRGGKTMKLEIPAQK